MKKVHNTDIKVCLLQALNILIYRQNFEDLSFEPITNIFGLSMKELWTEIRVATYGSGGYSLLIDYS